MRIRMPVQVQVSAIRFASLPAFRNACQQIQFGAIAAIVFRTAAFDRSATPPMH